MSARRGPVASALLVLAMALLASRVCADPQDYRVGPGDVLDISIVAGGEAQEHSTGAVALDGSIQCPLVGVVRVAGMSAADIASELRTRLARDYYVDPRVAVMIKEFGATVSVSGEVRRPGVYRLNEARTALGACVLAGGFSEFASARSARVIRVRAGRTQVLRVDLARAKQGRGEDPPLEAGDRVEIPRRLL